MNWKMSRNTKRHTTHEYYQRRGFPLQGAPAKAAVRRKNKLIEAAKKAALKRREVERGGSA